MSRSSALENYREFLWTEPATQCRKVTLVTPPSSFLLDERVFVSLGILKIASVLEARGNRVGVLDLSGIENYLDPLKEHLEGCEDFAIGITTTTPQLPSAIAIAKTVREHRPDIRLILGGPHVTLCYAAVKAEKKRGVIGGRAARACAQLESMFDVICCGDGEIAISVALADDPPKVIDGDEPEKGLFLDNALYTDSPYPARHLVDMASYHYEIEGLRSTSLIGQLGCPFSCGFCGGRSSKSLRAIRSRSVSSIIEEMTMLHREHGFRGFMFYDDELNVSKSMVQLMNAIADLQQKLGVEFRLRGFVKSELFTAEQAEAMVRAGFRWLLCGFEAGHPQILRNINKKATLDDNSRCVGIARQAGLKIKALMSCGHPGESEETVKSIADWLIRSQVDDFDCTVITTYPGTPYYDFAVPHESLPGVWTYTYQKSGDRLHAYDVDFTKTADYYKGDPKDGYKAFVFTDYLSSEQIVELRNWVEAEVRSRLGIAFNPSRAALRYEHSMGQGIPDFILRQSQEGALSEKVCS